MKYRILTFIMLMVLVFSAAGCQNTNELDICDPVIREYLNARTEKQQLAVLERSAGVNLAKQVLSFEWENSSCKKFKVSFADNEKYENAQVYETAVPRIEPEGIFVPGMSYYWKVENGEDGTLILEDTFQVKDGPVRFITTSQVSNVRDMGGWKTESGDRVKYGLIYRGGKTNTGGENQFPEKDVILLRDTLGIKTEIDLRTPRQDDGNQTVSILGEDAPYYKLPMHGYCCIIPDYLQMQPVFRSYNRANTEAIRELFHILANEENYPVYIHCNAGADRTGTVAYLINGLLGVSYEDLTRDFELTSFSAAGRRWRSEIVDGAFEDQGVMQDDQENYVAWGKMHQLMQEQYGAGSLAETVENYLRTVCNVPQEDIDSVRSILLEK